MGRLSIQTPPGRSLVPPHKILKVVGRISAYMFTLLNRNKILTLQKRVKIVMLINLLYIKLYKFLLLGLFYQSITYYNYSILKKIFFYKIA